MWRRKSSTSTSVHPSHDVGHRGLPNASTALIFSSCIPGCWMKIALTFKEHHKNILPWMQLLHIHLDFSNINQYFRIYITKLINIHQHFSNTYIITLWSFEWGEKTIVFPLSIYICMYMVANFRQMYIILAKMICIHVRLYSSQIKILHVFHLVNIDRYLVKGDNHQKPKS